MPLHIDQALQDVVTALRAKGVKANVDPAMVDLPGAWVTATQGAHVLMCGGVQLTVEIYLVVADKRVGQAWAELSALLDKAHTAVDPTEPTQLNEAIQLQGPHPLPCFKITTTTTA